MTYTFDEAIEHFRNNTDISGTAVFLDDVEDTLKELQEEYAPTVEMTVDEKNVLVDFKNHWTFTQFISAIEGDYENNMYFKKAEKTFRRMRIANGYMIDEDKLMQAWLHPENIKVVDE